MQGATQVEPRMARKPRVHVPGGFYHATLRGNHRQAIFHEPADRARLESLVAHAAGEVRARIHAYCWMTNHIHLLVEVGETPLGALMQRIASPYARCMQKRGDTTGHFFERRHHARLVDSERYLLTVIRYMHFNPVRGGLALHPDDYEWSSHRCYLGAVRYPWLTTEYALGMLGKNDADTRLAYRAYMAEAEGLELPSPFLPGTPVDARFVGDGEFIDAQMRPSPAAAQARKTLERLVDEICAQYSVAATDLRSRDCKRQLTAVRVEIARRALESGIASLSDVARTLGRSTAALGQALHRRSGRKAGEPEAPLALPGLEP
jgi:REP element-mobilizing transposase RayT